MGIGLAYVTREMNRTQEGGVPGNYPWSNSLAEAAGINVWVPQE